MDKKYILASGAEYLIRRRENSKIEIRQGKTETISQACILPKKGNSQEWQVVVEKPQQIRRFWIQHVRGKRILAAPGLSMELEAQEYSEGTAGSGGKLQPLKLTMPGKVLAVKVKTGDIVEPGQGLVIVEAMKMENLLQAPAKAKIAKVHIQEGDRLESGTILITFSPAE